MCGKMPGMTEDQELAWLAGLLEGEGAFMIHWKVSSAGVRYPTFAVACNLCDGDVLERVARVANVGTFSGPHPPQNPKHSPFWRWAVRKRKDVAALCAKLLPMMGTRRSAKIREILSLFEETGRAEWRHGTRQGYEYHKCKCDLCRGAHAKRFRDRRTRRASAAHL